MNLLNCFVNAFKMLLLGYVPPDLLYTDIKLKKALNCSEAKMMKIIRLARRKQTLRYLHDI